MSSLFVSEDEVERGLLVSLGRPQGGPDFYGQGLKFGRAGSFLLDRKLSSSMSPRKGGDGQELSRLAKRERSLLLVTREVNKALCLLVKLEGLVCYFRMGPSSFSLHWMK